MSWGQRDVVNLGWVSESFIHALTHPSIQAHVRPRGHSFMPQPRTRIVPGLLLALSLGRRLYFLILNFRSCKMGVNVTVASQAKGMLSRPWKGTPVVGPGSACFLVHHILPHRGLREAALV